MKISFKDGSFVEFKTSDNGLNILMSGKKQDGTITYSSSFLDKVQVLDLVKFLFGWLDK